MLFNHCISMKGILFCDYKMGVGLVFNRLYGHMLGNENIILAAVLGLAVYISNLFVLFLFSELVSNFSRLV